MGGNVVTFRVPWGKHSGEARPMLASVRGSCHWPGAVFSTDTCVCPCYFWRVADGNYNSDPLLGNYVRYVYHRYWLAMATSTPAAPDMVVSGTTMPRASFRPISKRRRPAAKAISMSGI